jgi:hypothetical protein
MLLQQATLKGLFKEPLSERPFKYRLFRKPLQKASSKSPFNRPVEEKLFKRPLRKSSSRASSTKKDCSKGLFQKPLQTKTHQENASMSLFQTKAPFKTPLRGPSSTSLQKASSNTPCGEAYFKRLN